MRVTIELAGSQVNADTHMSCAPGTIPQGHIESDPRLPLALGSKQADDQAVLDTHYDDVVGPFLLEPTLALAADVLDDLERVKIANENRLRQLTRIGVDEDGESRGFGLDARHPDVARLAAIVGMLETAEHDATLNLQRAMRAHPLGGWVKAQRGIGEKQGARLLAKIGDPYWNTLHDRPRTVSELWAYCGLHTLPASQGLRDIQRCAAGGASTSAGGNRDAGDTHALPVAARRRKGIKSNWSQDAKMRAWLIIQSCLKQIDPECKRDNGIGEHLDGCRCSLYRVTIDQRRQHTAVTHPDWNPGHSLNDAMRIASKSLLRDLWIEARNIHHLTNEATS